MDNHIQENAVEEQATLPEDAQTVGETEEQPGENAEATEPEEFDFAPFLEKIDLKVNKKPVKVADMEELIMRLQKGYDYDRVAGQRDDLRSDPVTAWAYEYIEDNGYSKEKPDEFISAAKEAKQKREIDKMVADKGIPEEIAQELLENKKFREKFKVKEKEEQAKLKEDEMYKKFAKKYPDVKTIPEDVWSDIKENGKDLLLAYADYENASLKDALKKASKEEMAAETSTGSVKGKGKTSTKHFTEDQVRGMSTDDVKKNYAAIMTSRKSWKKG